MVERLSAARANYGMSTDEVIELMRGPPADCDAPPPRKRR
jgi:hypothetical protein